MSIGTEKLGPYELRGELGRGAMAVVWRAWDPNLEREVAIKEPMFDPRLPADVLEEMGRRFVAEAKAAARLDHPNIVTIYAADVYDGRPAIVMELVDGATLSDLVAAGPMSPEAALPVLDQLLDAVGYAHEAGIVHRDIKPDNVFVDKRGRVKLADFGIAHVDGAAEARATVVGTVLGTPGYMSPEQAQGRPVDSRSDLFSVGVLGYEMLSGRNPFGAGDGADSTTLLYRIVHEPAPELPPAASAGLPADMRPAIMMALAKDPSARPQTAQVFKAILHGGIAQGGAGAGAATVPLAGVVPGAAAGMGTRPIAGAVPGTASAAGSGMGTRPLQGSGIGQVAPMQGSGAGQVPPVSGFGGGQAPGAGSMPRTSQFSSGSGQQFPSYGGQAPGFTQQQFAGASPAGGSLQDRVRAASQPQQPAAKKLPKWAPYVAVAAACVIVLLVVFVGATSGGAVGGGSNTTTNQVASQYHLSINSDGYVTVYSGRAGDNSRVDHVTDVSAGDLSADVANKLRSGVDYQSLEAANEQVGKYKADVEAAKEKAAEEKAAQAAEEAKKKDSTVTISVTGADGSTRTESIRRQGNTERVIPDSNTRRISSSEAAKLTDAERCIAWNEIIAASNGYAFKNGGLAAYFNSCSWYHRDAGASASGTLSAEASANVELLKSQTDSWWMNLATH